MKTQKIISGETVTVAILLSVIMTFTVCSNKNRNSTVDEKQSPISQKSPEPPSVDIHTATFLGDLKAIHQHIKAGSDLDERDPTVGSSPLITAAVFGKTDVAKALIEAGVDVDLQNNEGSTPLHTAAFFCRIEIVEALLEKGADKSVKNNYGSTALESVSGPFNNVKAIYDQFSKDLGPLGFKLDYEQVERDRPKIAEMLR